MCESPQIEVTVWPKLRANAEPCFLHVEICQDAWTCGAPIFAGAFPTAQAASATINCDFKPAAIKLKVAPGPPCLLEAVDVNALGLTRRFPINSWLTNMDPSALDPMPAPFSNSF